MKNEKIISVLIILSIFLLSSFASAFSWSDFFFKKLDNNVQFSTSTTRPVKVYVYDSDNNPVQNATVAYKSGSASIAAQKTGTDGITLNGVYLTIGAAYTFYITKQDYDSLTTPVAVIPLGSGAYQYSYRLMKSTTPAAPTPPTTRYVEVYVRDANENPIPDVSVIYKQGNTAIGSPRTTGANGVTTSSPQLTIGQSYTFDITKTGYNHVVTPAVIIVAGTGHQQFSYTMTATTPVTPSTQATRQVKMKILNIYGSSMQGASVQFKKGTTNIGDPLLTGSNGITPEITLNVGQTYNVVVSLEGYQNQAITTEGASVTISAGTEPYQYISILNPNQPIITRTSKLIKLRVTDSNTGAHIMGALIKFYKDTSTTAYSQTTTGPDYYAYINLETGFNYRMEISFDNYETKSYNTYISLEGSEDKGSFAITPRTTVDSGLIDEPISEPGTENPVRETQDDKGPETPIERATCTDDDPDNSLTIVGTCTPVSGEPKIDKCLPYPKNKIIQYSCKQNGQCSATSSTFCSIGESCLEGVCIKNREIVIGVKFSNDSLFNRLLRALGLK